AALARRVRQGGCVAQDEGSGTVDFAYLEGVAAGDRVVVDEGLRVVLQQAETWVRALDPQDGDWRDIVDTIKSAARGSGANALGDICARAEADGEGGLGAVRAALGVAVAEIAAYQARR